MVPHLVTALTGPINELEQRLLDSMSAIERWFRLEWMEHTPLFYSAVDIRNAGYKLAPVEISLFPSNWHNLTAPMLPLAVQAAMAAIEKICPEARNLLLIPQNQADCTFYLSNVAQLQKIFKMAGLNVRVGSIAPEIRKNTLVELPGGGSVLLEPVVRKKNGGRGRLGLKDFDPCTILLNNELSAGVPGILEDVTEQYLLPPLHATASQRFKSTYFKNYEEVVKRFGKLVGVDPWLINPLFEKCDAVDFSKAKDRVNAQAHADVLFTKIRRKYKEYGITEKPFIVVKTDGGQPSTGAEHASYRVVREAAELGQAHAGDPAPGNVILQEGVLTHERMNAAVAEPVVYLMDRYVVGGFYRIHADRRPDENLNSPGARYIPLAFADSTHLPQLGERPGASAPNRFYMYGVIARLAMLAASYELEASDPEAQDLD